jgi:hypothetical protein
MPRPHTHRHATRRPTSTHAACAALLSRLAALEAALARLAGPRGLAEAPPPLVRLVRDLVEETRALLPASAAPEAKAGTGFASRRRDRRKRRSSALPRLRPDRPVSHAELSVIAGQARATLAAFVSAKGLDKPPARKNPQVETLRKKLAARIDELFGPEAEKRLAEARRLDVAPDQPVA